MSTESTTDQNLSDIQAQGEAQSSLNQDFQIGIDRRKEALRIETEISKQLDLQFDQAKKILSSQQEAVTALVKQAQLAADVNANSEKRQAAINNIKEEMEEIVELNSISKGLQEDIKKAIDAQDFKEVAKLLEKGRGEMDQTNKFARDLDSHFTSFSKTLGITADVSKTGFGKLAEFTADFTTGNVDKKGELFLKSMKDLINPLNIVANLIDIVVQQAFALEKASISFAKATGFGRQFNDTMIDVAKETTLAGGTMETAAQSLGDLAKGMSEFAKLSKTAMRELSVLNFQLKQIGVANPSQIFEIFSRNLQKSSGEVQRLTRDLILSGTAAGITAEQMSSDFVSTFQNLAVNGERATEVFKDMAAQAKAAGVAVSDLVNLGKDFDTFSKGAEKASKLNAILGTQISHMQMLHMSDEQRSMEMIRQIKMAVGNFDALSRSEKLYIAQAIAGGDVAKAQKLINMSQAEYLQKKDQMAAAAKNQEEMRKMTEQLVPAVDQLKMAFMKVALTMKPLIDTIMVFLEVIGFLATLLSNEVVQALMVAAGAAQIFRVGLAAIRTEAAAAAGPLVLIGTGIMLLADHLGDGMLANSFKALGIGIMFAGVAMKFTSGKASLIIGAITTIITLLATEINPLFINFGFHMALGILAMGIAAKVGGVYLIGFTLALGVMFAAIALVVYATSALIKNMTGFLEILTMDKVVALYAFAGAMYAVAGALMLFSHPLAALGLLVFAGFAASIMLVGIGIEKLGKGVESYAVGLEKIRSVATDLSSAIGDSMLVGAMTGGKTTVAIGKNAGLASIFSNDKLTIDVKMPEISFPEISVKVYIDGEELSKGVRQEVVGARR